MMKKRMLRGILLLLAAALTLLSGGACQKQSQEGLDRVVLALDWTPNTNHSGLFLASDLGYYREENIEIVFRESDMDFIEMVAGGSAAFGLAAQEQVLQARASAASVPVVALAAVLAHNTSGFASPVDRGILSPADFQGMTYSGWGTEMELAIIDALMKKQGADFSQVKLINQSAGNFIASMELEADFAWIYYGWDGVNCQLASYLINYIPLTDMEPDLDFYSPVLITNEETIRDKPDLIRRFLRATAKGYAQAMAHPDQAVASLLKAAPGLDPDLLLASQLYLNDHYLGDSPYWGAIDPGRWNNFARWMEERGLLDRPIDPADAFTTDYLPRGGEGH